MALGARRQCELGLEGPVHRLRVHLLTLDHDFHHLSRSSIPLIGESIDLEEVYGRQGLGNEDASF